MRGNPRPTVAMGLPGSGYGVSLTAPPRTAEAAGFGPRWSAAGSRDAQPRRACELRGRKVSPTTILVSRTSSTPSRRAPSRVQMPPSVRARPGRDASDEGREPPDWGPKSVPRSTMIWACQVGGEYGSAPPLCLSNHPLTTRAAGPPFDSGDARPNLCCAPSLVSTPPAPPACTEGRSPWCASQSSIQMSPARGRARIVRSLIDYLIRPLEKRRRDRQAEGLRS
jgi:hypothetical protein